MYHGEHSLPSARKIVAVAMRTYKIGPRDFLGGTRLRHIVRIRYAAISVAWELGVSRSPTAIGRAFNRDGSTIQHALRQIATFPHRYAPFADVIKRRVLE